MTDMDSSELKKLMINSLNRDGGSDPAKLEAEGVSYDFSRGFSQRVIQRLLDSRTSISREIEFSRYLSYAFSRIALTGIAAIVVLLLSILLMEGSISFNSIIGLGDTYDESIVYLLTGN